jgi:hypothetical protein
MTVTRFFQTQPTSNVLSGEFGLTALLYYHENIVIITRIYKYKSQYYLLIFVYVLIYSP